MPLVNPYIPPRKVRSRLPNQVFPSRLNLKTTFGLQGNGNADDSAAFQDFLTAWGTGSANVKDKAGYLPNGTYVVTQNLFAQAKKFVSLHGESCYHPTLNPQGVRILWEGPINDDPLNGSCILRMDGVTYSSFSNIFWDGNDKVHSGVYHAWTQSATTNGFAVTHNEHRNSIFANCKQGLRAGLVIVSFPNGQKYYDHKMDAETGVISCQFWNNTISGLSIEAFNALDWYVWDSVFEKNKDAITNNPDNGNWYNYSESPAGATGAGNMHAFDSHFIDNENDFRIRNTNYFAIRGNYSRGAKRFFKSEPHGFGGPISITHNQVELPQETLIIESFNNAGPFTIKKNRFKNKAGQKGVVGVFGSQAPVVDQANILTQGTYFHAPNSKFIMPSPKSVALPAQYIHVNPPPILDCSGVTSYPVYEMNPAADSTAQWNAATVWASQRIGQRPVVLFNPGSHGLQSGWTMAENLDVQLISDNWSATIEWQDPQSNPAIEAMIVVEGAEKKTFSGFQVKGGSNQRKKGFLFKHKDNPSMLINAEHCSTRNGSSSTSVGISVKNFASVVTEFRNMGHAYHAGTGVKVDNARMNCFAGSSGENAICYDIVNGAKLLVSDIWYESNGSYKTFLNLKDSGDFAFTCAKVFATGTPDINTIIVNGHNGRVTLENMNVNGRINIQGNGTNTKVLSIANEFKPPASISSEYWSNTSSPAAKAKSYSSTWFDGDTGNRGGSVEVDFIEEMSELLLYQRPQYKYKTEGLLLNRIYVELSNGGFSFEGTTYTPVAPRITVDSVNRTIGASHPYHGDAIEYRASGGSFQDYSGKITFGNGAIAQNTYEFRIKAGFNRTVSGITGHVAIAASIINPPAGEGLGSFALNSTFVLAGTGLNHYKLNTTFKIE